MTHTSVVPIRDTVINDLKTGCSPDAPASMTDIARDNSLIIDSILNMTHSVNCHLFGGDIGASINKECSPVCFMDELTIQHQKLKEISEELGKVCSLLGI